MIAFRTSPTTRTTDCNIGRRRSGATTSVFKDVSSGV
jgi:hypothetical protein